MIRTALHAAVVLAAATPVSALASETFEVVAELDAGPGNVTVTPDGRIILSLHQFYDPELRVVELRPDGSLEPFPTPEWAGARTGVGVGLTAVLGLRSDRDGIIWMLDNGGGDPALTRLVGWDTRTDALHRIVEIPPEASIDGSFHNDLALDQERPLAYLADIAGGLAVVDLETGDVRRVLDDHRSTAAEDVDFIVRGELLTTAAGDPLRTGLNPITISVDNAHVYYGAMNGMAIWRVPTAVLADPGLSSDEVAAEVERFGDKPPSDGITIDAAGNVYVTDGGGNAIGVTRPDGAYSVLIADPLIRWPDGLSMGPDGWVYATINALDDAAPLNAGVEGDVEGDWRVIRFRPEAEAVVGR